MRMSRARYPGMARPMPRRLPASSPAVECRTVAARRKSHVLALHLAHRPDAPHRRRGRSLKPTARRRCLPASRWTTSSSLTTGLGPLFHRTYRTRIRETRLTVEDLLERVAANPDCVAPSEFASFVKLHGEPGRMRVGDEYRVRMAGPWDGPVRVIERTPTSFRLATLDGHLEAGQIRFSAQPRGDMIVFEIESWARSASPVVNVLYDRLRMAKEIQVHMWVSVLQRVAELAGGRVTGGIDIHTRRVADHATSGVAQASRSAARPARQLRSRGSPPGVRGLAYRRVPGGASVRAARAAGRHRAVPDGPGAAA